MGKTTRLQGRLLRSLRDWNPATDGPLIEVGTLVVAFRPIPSTIWLGALADTGADGRRPLARPGIEGRKYQGIRIGVLARGLVRWIGAQNPHLSEEYIARLVGELVEVADRRRADARQASIDGMRLVAAEKREARAAEKPARKASKAPKVTSDALFKVW